MNIKSNILKGLNKTRNGFLSAFRYLDKNPTVLVVICGLLLNFIVEALSRHSVADGFLHMITRPLPFLFNSLIIITVLSISNLFKHRYFFLLFLSAVFLGFGIANCVVLYNRVTPFEWADLQVVKFSIIRIYLSTFEIILVIFVILAAIAALIIFFIKCPKSKVNYIKNSIYTGCFAILLTLSLVVFRSNNILMSEHVKNLANAYKDYGFNYCFLCSMLDLGIDKPSQYDSDDVQKIVASLNASANEKSQSNNNFKNFADGDRPNVIFLQLETFFDINHLSGVKFSQNPIPNFTRLQKEYTTGYLSVPSIGAGTANTEFEVLSGMSLNYFGVGEYPYKTVLQNNSCESICYNLSPYGYKNHAIHNNTASFYDRNLVFSNLGFDTFTSIEYMQDVSFAPNGWAKDDVLIGCIKDCLDSTKEQDFVYAITVQSHGKYPSNYDYSLPISATGFADQETGKAFEYYINQLYEVDAFVGNLIDTLKTRDEKTVVVMFGDHLPSFDITEEDLLNNDLFQTEYVIWDNFGMNKQDENLTTYQLGATVLEAIGCNNGLITKLHQNEKLSSQKYHEQLEVLMYDMLYGDKYAFGGKELYPYGKTDLKMGVKDIVLDKVSLDTQNNSIRVTGQNFTNYSKILINGKTINTTLLDNNTLMALNASFSPGDYISVAQIDDESTVLSETFNYIIGGTTEHPVISVNTQTIYRRGGINTITAIAIISISAAVVALCITVIILIKKKKLFNKAKGS